MHALPQPLMIGNPRFSDPALQARSARDGLAAAWGAALQAQGRDALAQVTGDFALGVTMLDGTTWLAVDKMGIQTLCYRVRDGQIRYGARADDLLDADETPAIDDQAVFDYLYFHVIPAPRTIYAGIFRVPPGHCVTFSQGQLTVFPYWTAHFEERTAPDFAALQERFRGLLRTSVEQAMDASKPACFLSGGTDSSTVAGMMAATGAKVATYSIGFDAEGYDEMNFARLAAKRFGADHYEYYVTPADLVNSIPSLAAHFDQPFGNSSVLPAYYCAKMAADDGVGKLLAGDGGDELFGGNARYAKQRLFGFYQNIPSALRQGVVEPLLDSRAAQVLAPMRKAASYVQQARVPMPDRLQMYNLITRLGLTDVLAPEFLARIDVSLPLALQREVWHAPAACSRLNRELHFDWRFTLADADLPKVRWATGFAGIGVGFPLLSEELLAFSLSLPSDYKLRGPRLRWFFKEALRGFLPDEIIEKKKQGFGLPFGVWATKSPELLKLASDSLASLSGRGVVRADFIGVLLRKHLQEYPGYYGEMVWILMMLEQWLQRRAPDYRVH